MRKRNVAVVLSALLLASFSAQASIDLIATGSISGTYQDLSTETAAPLENGVPGNRLGGIGSGLAWAGGTTFLALPDRGPNAKSYNSAIDDTSSYIARFQTLNLALQPSDAGSALPYTLTPTLIATTLLSSKEALVYGSGAGLGVGSGAPALNAVKHRYYFTGRSDNFDPAQPSTNPSNARLDPESIRVAVSGRSVFVSDEYGPYIDQFDRITGRRLRSFVLPPKFAVATPSAQGAVEIAGNTSGRIANKGMEGLAITPDGKMLVGILQSPLIQDGGSNGPITRIVTVRIANGAVSEYAYPLTNIGTSAKPKYPTVSEILAINDHEFLVDERDGKGFNDNSTAVFKRLYQIDLTGAADVSALSGAENLADKTVSKTLFLDLVSALNAHGYSSQDIPAKLEGLAFGPDLVENGVTRHTLYVANDNDFVATVTDSNHPAGADNGNRWFVFAIDAGDLRDYVPQQIGKFDLGLCDDLRGDLYDVVDVIDDRTRR